MRVLLVFRSQWFSGIVSSCGVQGPRFEPHDGRLCLSQQLLQCAALCTCCTPLLQTFFHLLFFSGTSGWPKLIRKVSVKVEELVWIFIVEAEEQSSSDADEVERSVQSSFGGGSESGEIVPGKSVVFAALEVCLCALVRHLPSLNPSLPSASVLASAARQTTFNDTTYQLLSSTLLTMAELPSLCSPAGLWTFVWNFFCFW